MNKKHVSPKTVKTDTTDQEIYDRVYGKSLDSFWNFILSLFGIIKR